MNVIIAEKPSVAQSIAKVVNAKERKDGYFQGNDYIVSWCVGHLVSLANPEEYDPNLKSWKLETLPIIPEKFEFTVVKDKIKQFEVLKKLLNSKDTTKIICATDAGREGELIFRLVYEKSKCKKSFKRLWISSMEDEAIKQGLENLKPGKNYDNLYKSALCRTIADWVVGINSSRLYSINYSSNLNIGRVQTPTVAMIVERELAIKNFVKEKYFTISIKKGGLEAKTDKITLEDEAKKIQEKCNGKNAVCTSFDKTEKSLNAPILYDLTTLQRECNRLFGYTAQETLDTVQKLYESKIVTYPRTDSNFITDDMEHTIPDIINILTEKLDFIDAQNITINTKPIVNNAKVSDHTAIIPTKKLKDTNISTLKEIEKNILYTICVRLLIATAEKHVFFDVTAVFDCEGHNYKAKGKSVLNEGFRAIEKQFKKSFKIKTAEKEEVINELPIFEPGETIENVESSINERFTSPPKRYTEDTLLSAMENAGNKDYEEVEDIEKKGLGTPATRAGIIERIIKTEYIERERKALKPTEKGVNIIAILPESLKSAKLTADWETKLQQIEKGTLEDKQFTDEITIFINDVISSFVLADNKEILFKSSNSSATASNKEVIGVCPRCSSDVYESEKSFYCSNRDCKFALWRNSKFFEDKRAKLTKAHAKEMIKNGKSKFDKLYSPTKDKEYSAYVAIAFSGDYVNYKLEF